MYSAIRARRTRVLASLAFCAAALVYWRTAYPTITWWDSSSYSLAAATLGVASPPGSLLLTLLGWPVAHLAPDGSPARALNLFAGVLAALTVSLLVIASTQMLRAVEGGRATESDRSASAAGAALGALAFAFGGTLWSYAGRFTPYVLTPVLTCLILWTLLRWWRDAELPTAWRWLAALGLLFGLDFSVHRTNALLIPGALVWVAIRRPRALREVRSVAGAAGGLFAGLAFQLLLMPLAALTHSSLDFNHPASFSEFRDYVTLKQLGGSFLLDLFPRKSPVWAVQTHDLLRVIGENFANWHGRAGALGVLPAVAAAIGLTTSWRANRRLAVAFALLIVTQAVLTVLYFNIPANFFRSFDRHYVPVCVTIAALVACGVGAALRWAAAQVRAGSKLAGVAIAALAVLVPCSELGGNWSTYDASRRFFARDYAANVLQELPPKAIYFTVGDNDTFPVMYLQSVEGVRPDITIINLSVANIPDWPERLHRRDPRLPLSLTLAERTATASRRWADTTIVLPVSGTSRQLAVPAGAKTPASIPLEVKPQYGTHMLPAEIVLLDIVRTNAWRRPITFAISGTRSAMEWLAPYGRPEGLYFRIVPLREPESDPSVLRAHVLRDLSYRGYADPSVRVDDATRRMGTLYYAALESLLEADMTRGDTARCRIDRQALLAKVPFERLDAPREIRAPIESACG